MPNTTNEVVINGEVVLSTRGNTVTEDTLVQGKTAQDKTGKEIEGNLDPVSHEELNELKEQVDALDEEAYKLSDEEGEISESDYIPFNDASDGNEPKKKTLFSSIIDKLKDIFAQKSDLKKHTFEVGTALPTSTIIDNYHTDDFVGTYYIESDAVASEITTLPEDLSGKLIVANNGNGGFSQYYIPNDSVKLWVRLWWENAWSAWQDISSGGGDSKPHTYDKGTAIPANSDLDDYKTEGVYFVADTGTAETIDNIPVAGAGKLIVMDRDTGARIFQIYIASKDNIYIRDMNNDSVFSAWKNISKSHTFELGEMIPSNSDLDSYKTEGVYYVQLDSTASTISNVPVIRAGKLVVAKTTSANNYLIQTYCANASTDIYVRWYNPNGDSWHDWKNLSRSHSFEDGTDIPADSDLNDYKTAGVYTTTNDATASTIANMPVSSTGKLIVSYSAPSHNYIQQIYIVASTNEIYTRYYDNWNSTWRGWKQIVTTAQLKPHTFELGTAIPANSDLNNYTTVGVYNIELDATAKTIANIPVGNAGKLVVSALRNTSNIRQTYYKYNNSSVVYSRIYNSGWTSWVNIYSGVQSDDIVLNHQNGSLWSQIKHRINGDKRLYVNFSLDGGSTWDGDKQIALTSDISPSTVGNGYAVATVSGSAITATISGFQLRAGVIVALRFNNEVAVDCTLNISSTGTKSVRYWADNTISYGKSIKLGITTFIYDGTYYRIISLDRTPSIGEQNYVADTSGNIVLDWGYGSNRAQIKHNLSNNKLQFNYYKNSAWRGDYNIVDEYGRQTMSGWLGLKTSNGRTIASGAHSMGVQDTIPNILNELRYSNGAWGSLNLTTAYTKDYTTIPTGWYNYFYIPHRVGGENWATPTSWDADNVQYGTLLLFGMNNTNGMFRLRWANGSVTELEDIQKGNCYVGTCTTAGGTKDKEATVDGNFVLRKGVTVAIKFTNTNSYSNVTTSPVTLNVNSTGAKNIWYGGNHSGAGNTGVNTTPYGRAGYVNSYVYDGTYWVWQSSSADNDGNNRKSFYGTCSTAGDQQVKVVTLADTSGWELRAGTIVGVKFTNTNTYSATADNHIQLNVNNTGAKNIYYNTGYPTGTSNIVFGTANRVHYYMYNGTDWCWMNHGVDLDTVDPRVLGFGYGTCTTAEATTAKVVTLSSYTLRTGGYVSVKFSYNVPANATMNINSRGAKNIWYRGANITANVIKANDLATFIYDGTRYQLVGIDRNCIEFHASDVTILSSINSCIVAKYIYGNLNGNQLFFKMEISFKPTSAITVSTSDDFISFNDLRGLYQTNNFTWQDVQGYFDYTNMTPMVIGNYSGNNGSLKLRFRSTQNFTANTQRTLRLNFTALVEQY